MVKKRFFILISFLPVHSSRKINTHINTIIRRTNIHSIRNSGFVRFSREQRRTSQNPINIGEACNRCIGRYCYTIYR